MALYQDRKLTIRSLLSATIISIAIGTVFLLIGSHGHKITFFNFLWNAGYSTSLGLALFSNGFIFQFVERKYISWIKSPLKSIFIALGVHLSYSTVVIVSFNWLWFVLFRKQTINDFFEYGWFIIIGEYIVLVLITAIIYAKSFFKDYRNEAIEGEKLKQEAMSLQYQIMQNQVNPHFLFNALNILGSLIDVDKEKAKIFTRELSLFYRELLHFKNKEIIPLNEELSFVKKYIYLQKIRFGDNFNVEILLNENIEGEVIPMSLQMMLENAVKHNIISKNQPLSVIIGKLEGAKIFIENNHQPKENVDGSNKIGLKNLQKRYKYLTNQDLIIDSNSDYFRVTIPLIIVE